MEAMRLYFFITGMIMVLAGAINLAFGERRMSADTCRRLKDRGVPIEKYLLRQFFIVIGAVVCVFLCAIFPRPVFVMIILIVALVGAIVASLAVRKYYLEYFW